jgi:tetratricopeptide (TPR) repeat protein
MGMWAWALKAGSTCDSFDKQRGRDFKVEKIRFIFWEVMKILSLAFLGLLAAKAVATWHSSKLSEDASRNRWVKGALYSAMLALIGLGAGNVGYDVAGEAYLWASEGNVEHSQPDKAYSNALRAVQLRPGFLRYWRQLETSKVYLRQFQSALDDMPALRAVSGGVLDENDAYRFVVCYFYLGQYDKVISASDQLIQQNSQFAAPYVLQGLAYTAEQKYPDAERSFRSALQIFPNHQAAVEGLARAYFLAGERAKALAVLDETSKYAFPPEARKRFEALKGLYAQ